MTKNSAGFQGYPQRAGHVVRTQRYMIKRQTVMRTSLDCRTLAMGVGGGVEREGRGAKVANNFNL